MCLEDSFQDYLLSVIDETHGVKDELNLKKKREIGGKRGGEKEEG